MRYYDGTTSQFYERKKEIQRKYLEELARTGTPATAIKNASNNLCTTTNLKAWRKNSRIFSTKEHNAVLQFKESIFNEAVKRARDGVAEPVLYKGVPSYQRDPQTGDYVLDEDLNPIPLTVLKKSDTILSKLLETLCKNGDAIVRSAIRDSDEEADGVNDIVIDFTAASPAKTSQKKKATKIHGTPYTPDTKH